MASNQKVPPPAASTEEETRSRPDTLGDHEPVTREARTDEIPDEDLFLYEAANQRVDFAPASDLREQAQGFFEDRDFENAIRAAEDAGRAAGSTEQAFLKSTRAHVILASQRIVDASGKAGQPVDDAEMLLREAKQAFRVGSLESHPDLISNLAEAARTLYVREVDRVRGDIDRVKGLIVHVANTGASVAPAERMLNEARDALRGHDPFLAGRVVRDAELQADDILRARIREIEDAIPETAALIDEARHVGASVDEAERLLTEARGAAFAKDYVSAAQLVTRAEREALKGQHRQIEIAMDLRRRQLARAEDILRSVEPLVDEADEFDLNVTEARTLIRQARDIVAKEDYLNGMIFARNAAEVARRLERRVIEERERRGIRMPKTGVCAACTSTRMSFRTDGWARCSDCGHEVRWREPTRLLGRVFRGLRR